MHLKTISAMANVIPKDVPSMAPKIIATAIVCCSLTTIFVALRIYTRLRIIRVKGWDDYAALIALPFCIAQGSVICMATRYGVGLHMWDLPIDLEVHFSMWLFITGFVYLPSLLAYKMSILFLYLRIFSIEKVFRYCTWLVMFITFGYLFSNLGLQILTCQPIAKIWTPEIPGHCITEMNKPYYAYCSLNFITDLLIFALPLPMVWRLKLSLKEKVEVSAIFMLGSL